MPLTSPDPQEGSCSTASEAAKANAGPDRPWADGVRMLRLNHGHFQLEAAPEKERKGATCTGPAPNPRKGGVALRERRLALMRHRTAPGRAELGRSGLTRALFDPRLPLRHRERGLLPCGGP